MASTSRAATQAGVAGQTRGGIAARTARLIAAHPYTAMVFALGIVARAILMPITHGQDFVVWDLASRATLAGSNIYAHHPHYPGGPYTYFPLFLYLELPMQWLALHAGISFTVLGKLPIVAGDVLAAACIAVHVARRNHGDGVIALATALYFLNPLVLYNGAFYGRFDALCVGLLLLALATFKRDEPRSWRFPLLYAAAAAAKTYPIFILPWLLVREPARRVRVVIALAAVVGGLSLPYLLTSFRQLFADVVLYDGRKLPGNLSWQIVFIDYLHLPSQQVRLISYGLLALFVVALFLYTRLDLYTYSLVAILLFLVLSKVLIEQYFLWPMPFLIFAAVERRSWASWALLIFLTATGFFVNPYVHPLQALPWNTHLGQRMPPLNVLLGLCMAAYVLTRRPMAEEKI